MTNQVKCNFRHKGLNGLLLLLFLFFTLTVSSQTVNVSGVVSDDSGPLPGVSVVVKGTSKGAATDFDGNYVIQNVESNAVLVFSYIGYKDKEVPVSGRSVINVALEEDLTQLEEVVVVGYGTMERANVTGAITTVDVLEANKAPVTNFVESLRGQVAGLQVTRNTGQPGSQPVFTIRGNNSLGGGSDDIEGSNAPIIVVDGVPLVGGNLAEFNPDDIESINVLKDAASASIYGSSGANGAILITTKSGQKGKTKISVTSSSGFVDLVQTPDIMNGDEFLKFKFDVEKAGDPNAINPSVASVLDPIEYQNFLAGNEVDWLEQVMRTGIQQNLGLAISGGTERATFYLNGDYVKETGPLVASDYDRFSLRFNGDYQAYDWLKVGARVQLSKSFADQRTRIVGFGNDGVPSLSALVESSPYGNLYDENGNYSKFATTDLFAVNPLHKFNESELDVNVTRSYINPFVNINITEGLTYTLNAYAEERSEFLGRFQSTNFTDGANNLAQIRDRDETTYLLDNILNYKKSFGKHGLNLTLVYGMQQYEWTEKNNVATKTAADELGYWGIGTAPSETQDISLNTNDWAKVYLVGRIGYNYDGRYSTTLTLRRDTSDKFIGDGRVGYFPSASVAWNAHKENWWFGEETLNNLKLRLSYGELGNDRVPKGFNAYTTTVLIPPDNDITGLIPGDIGPSPDIKWENSKQFNIGLDFGMFNNRLNGSFEYYNTKTDDLLLRQIIPGALNSGYTTVFSNIGKTESKGVEVSLRGDVLRTDDFTWNMGVNWTSTKNEIIRLGRLGANGEPIDDEPNGWFIGKDIQEIYGYEYLGNWQLGETPDVTNLGVMPQPGDPKFADISGPNGEPDGNIDAYDRTFLGNPTPDWYAGINNVFTYKGFELSVLFEIVEGVSRINDIYNNYNSARQNRVNINYWTPENPTNDYPKVGTGTYLTGRNGEWYESIFVEDASFIALRNVSLSYSLPQKYLDKTFLSNVSFSLSGNNLKYWTDYKNAYSPEVTNTDQYPISRTWAFGVKLTL